MADKVETLECTHLIVHGDVEFRGGSPLPSDNYLMVEHDLYDTSASIYEYAPRAPERQEALDYLSTLPQDMPVLILTPRSVAEMSAVREFARSVHADLINPDDSRWSAISRGKIEEMNAWAEEHIGKDLPRTPPDPEFEGEGMV
jgi:hypothetical protein